MTVIYTETYITSDPVYTEDKTSFTIALSSISIECHMHRDENIKYIRENKIRTGDLVGVDGVFMAELKSPGVYWIKVFTLELLSGKQKKKRRQAGDGMDILKMIDQRLQQRLKLPLVASPTKQNTGLYKEFTGGFSDYFFMLYGLIGFVTNERKEERERLLEIMTRIYNLFSELTQESINEYKLSEFVNLVTELIYKINNSKQIESIYVPSGLVIDSSVPLPTIIYNNFIKE